MKALSWISRLRGNQRGNVLAIGAATLPLVIGAGALGLDTVQYALWKRQLQRAADSGALAGARALAQGKPVNAAVTRDLQLNNQVPLNGAAVVQNAPAAGSFAGNASAVRVLLNSQQTLPFWSFFTGSSPSLQVTATAMLVRQGQFCMMALEDGPVTAITLLGNADLDLGCGIASNSTGEDAISAGGSSSVTASPLLTVGGIDMDNSKFANSTKLPYSSAQQNPFADRPDPTDLTSGMNCSAAFDEANPQPGCYSAMSINGTVTLPAGTYYIKNGDATFGSHANVTGVGVTLVFTGDGDNIGSFDMQGQAELHLKAPKQLSDSTPYQGIVMYRDDDRATMDTLRINGGQELDLEGAMYFPKTKLWFNGNSSVTSECLQIVAQQLQFNGGADISNNCADGYGSALTGTFVRLVE